MNEWHKMQILREVYQNLSHTGANSEAVEEDLPGGTIERSEVKQDLTSVPIPDTGQQAGDDDGWLQETAREKRLLDQRHKKRSLDDMLVPTVPTSVIVSHVDSSHREASLLEQDFAVAVFEIGLRQSSPKVLKSLMMPTEDLTTEHIKSHLQKYRLHYDRSKDEFLGHYRKYLRLDPQTPLGPLEKNNLNHRTAQDENGATRHASTTDNNATAPNSTTNPHAIDDSTIQSAHPITGEERSATNENNSAGIAENSMASNTTVGKATLQAKGKRELAQLQRIQAIHNQLVHEQLELQNTLQAQMHEQLQLQAELNTLMREATAVTNQQQPQESVSSNADSDDEPSSSSAQQSPTSLDNKAAANTADKTAPESRNEEVAKATSIESKTADMKDSSNFDGNNRQKQRPKCAAASNSNSAGAAAVEITAVSSLPVHIEEGAS